MLSSTLHDTSFFWTQRARRVLNISAWCTLSSRNKIAHQTNYHIFSLKLFLLNIPKRHVQKNNQFTFHRYVLLASEPNPGDLPCTQDVKTFHVPCRTTPRFNRRRDSKHKGNTSLISCFSASKPGQAECSCKRRRGIKHDHDRHKRVSSNHERPDDPLRTSVRGRSTGHLLKLSWCSW